MTAPASKKKNMMKKQKTNRVESPLARTRRIIAAWPETDERLSHGAPTWWGGKKTFATFHDNHHGDGRVALWIKADSDTQEDLVAANPDQFFVPPYVGHRGWLGVIVEGLGRNAVDWHLVEGLLEAGYRSVAPSRAVRALDASKSR